MKTLNFYFVLVLLLIVMNSNRNDSEFDTVDSIASNSEKVQIKKIGSSSLQAFTSTESDIITEDPKNIPPRK
ncbi:hypothetical protein [Chryseobacterium lactis]|uniref:hypothetical protein n=1 Tax=Chryseobacterium lactis TaxID=1241981 RepID=UPI000F4FFCFC|nr:hypothetical protein [Chryseobacterium lactis]